MSNSPASADTQLSKGGCFFLWENARRFSLRFPVAFPQNGCIIFVAKNKNAAEAAKEIL